MTPSTWLGLVIAGMLGTSDFLGGYLSRRAPLVAVLLSAQAALVALAWISWALFARGETSLTPGYVWGLMAGCAQAIGVASLFRALAIGRMGVVAPLSALAVLVPLGAGIVAGEGMTILRALGIALAVSGGFLASGPEFRKRTDESGSAVRMSILLALIAAMGFGTSQLMIALGSQRDLWTTLTASSSTAFIFYLLAGVIWWGFAGRGAVSQTKKLPNQWQVYALAMCIGILNFGANAIFGWSSTTGPLSLLAVLAALYPLMTAGLARAFLGERLLIIQRYGSVMIVMGIALIALPV